jgi:glucose/arabinose dehydrogenase
LICVSILVVASDAKPQAVTGLDARRVASGLSQPLFVTAPPGDYDRLFIVCQTGQVQVLNLSTGALTLFIDLTTISNPSFRGGGEQGLLGMAFDPNYATNGKFYLNFTVNSAPGDTFQEGVTHISQFTLSAIPPYHADTSTEKILLTFQHPEANHNGGWIGFSPRAGDENNLYISTGDGGNGNDQDNNFGHIEPTGNAQNLTTVLGKMLRIHVDSATGTASIPPGNPFVGTSGARGEIWAYGLRNPFRNSFDRATGRMFIGDVGQETREEVDVQQASNPGGGENYGWRLREGTISTPTGNPVVGGSPPPGNVEPILDYPHTIGATVIGGYVYRGRQIPQLRGVYVFGDYVFARIFTLNYNGTSASNFQDITGQLFPTTVGNFLLGAPASFGEDANGELYITDIGNGNVYQIVPTTPNVTIDSVAKQPGGPVVLKGTGVPFTNVTVQSTSNLAQAFTFLATVPVAGNGTFEFDDATSSAPRFYRVVYP